MLVATRRAEPGILLFIWDSVLGEPSPCSRHSRASGQGIGRLLTDTPNEGIPSSSKLILRGKIRYYTRLLPQAMDLTTPTTGWGTNGEHTGPRSLSNVTV